MAISVVAACPLGLRSALAQAPASPVSTHGSDIIVTAPRLPQRKGEVLDTIPSSTIKAYAANSIGELLSRMGARFGAGGVSVIVNGRRLASADAIDALPPEALAQIDVLAASAAGQYGFAGTGKVINLVLRPRFQFATGEGSGTATTEGGGDSEVGALRYAYILNDKRLNAALTYTRQGALRETDRAQLGETGDDAAQAPYRSLAPHQDAITFTVGLAAPLKAANIDFSTEAGLTQSHALTGPVANASDVVGAHPNFYVSAQRNGSRYVRSTGMVSGTTSGFFWTLQTSADLTMNNTTNIRAKTISLSADAMPGEHALTALDNDVSSRTRSAGLAASLNGSVGRLPAGAINVEARVGANVSDLRSRVFTDPQTESGNSYKSASAHGSVRIPITQRGANGLAFLGDLSASQQIDYTGVNKIGGATGFTTSVDWSPSPALQFSLSHRLSPNLPSLTQLYAPIISRSGVLIYDAVSDAIVPVTVIGGGSLSSRTSTATNTTLAGTFQKGLAIAQFSATLSYILDQTRHPLISLSNPSPIAQQLLPELFVRNDSGLLLEFDTRPVNGQDETTRRVSTSFHLAGPGIKKGEPPSPSTLAAHHPVLTWDVNLSYTYTIEDSLSLASGRSPVNLLSDPLNLSATSPARHQVDVQWTISNSHYGLNGSLGWRSGARVQSIDSASVQAVRFSPVTKFDLEGFVELDRSDDEANPRSLRLTLGIANILDERLRIFGYAGLNENLQAAIADPYGRTIKVSVRKSL